MKRLFSLLSVFFLLASFEMEAKEFYALLAGDTISNVKTASIKDIKHIKKELQEIAKITKMNLHVKQLKGRALTQAAFHKWVQEANIGPDDVVFFYFTGHGYRTKRTQTIWPCIVFPTKNEVIDFTDVIQHLTSRPCALCFVIADCCNNFPDKKQITKSYQTLTPKIYELASASHHAYQKLFNYTQGVIIASGSTPGKRSFCTENGSIFTNALLSSLKHELYETDPHWEHILLQTKVLCHKFQSPQFQVYISPLR